MTKHWFGNVCAIYFSFAKEIKKKKKCLGPLLYQIGNYKAIRESQIQKCENRHYDLD